MPLLYSAKVSEKLLTAKVVGAILPQAFVTYLKAKMVVYYRDPSRV